MLFFTLFFPEWKETEKPLLVLQGVGEVEERRLEIMLVALHSQTHHLNLVCAQKVAMKMYSHYQNTKMYYPSSTMICCQKNNY